MVARALLLVALLATSGCATWCATGTGDGDPNYLKLLACSLVTPTPKPPADPGYPVTPGQKQERRLTVPCGVSFDITGARPGIADGGPEDNKHFAWAYETAFHGGNSSPGNGYTAAARSYKLKVYDKAGIVAKERSYPDTWNPALTYHVDFQITAEETTLTVTQAGVVVARAVTAAAAPEAVTVGIGWPEGRPGMRDAVLRGIAWKGVAP